MWCRFCVRHDDESAFCQNLKNSDYLYAHQDKLTVQCVEFDANLSNSVLHICSIIITQYKNCHESRS